MTFECKGLCKGPSAAIVPHAYGVAKRCYVCNVWVGKFDRNLRCPCCGSLYRTTKRSNK